MINFVRAVIKVLTFVKIRTYAQSAEELWLEEWTNPLQQQVPIENPIDFLDSLQHPNEQTEGQVFSLLFFHFLMSSP
jgi:proteasome activator subunit 4